MMAVVNHYSMEQRGNIAERIGAIFDLPDAGMKMTRDGWTMQHSAGDPTVTLTVELIAQISPEEAERIMNAVPLEKETA